MTIFSQCSPLTTCASCAKQVVRMRKQTRNFSVTLRTDQQVRMRRMMFQWLRQVGKNFREPLKDSPNYLSAYAPNGTLRRVAERSNTHARNVERIQTLMQKTPERILELQEELEQLQKSYSIESKTPPKPSRRDMMPFPANKDFVSEPVLGPWLQNEIWEDIVLNGLTVREVSAQRGVEMSRVAAVVRLIEVEKQWRQQGKEIADNYAKTVIDMLPYTGRIAFQGWSENDEQMFIEAKTEAKFAAQREIHERNVENAQRKEEKLPPLPPAQPIIPDDEELKSRIVEARRRTPHESINDLPILKSTGTQLWLPVSESRRFTRADAARAFNDNLQPADKRVPHPELTLMHKEWLAGETAERRTELQVRRAQEEREKIARRALSKKLLKDSVKKVITPRGVAFRFHEIKVEAAGKDGRGVKAVGWRYGVPNMDRSKGDLKIPQQALYPPRHMPKSKPNHWQRA